MAEGAPPSKRPKTDGDIFSLEASLPEELISSTGMPTATNGYSMASSHTAPQSAQMSVAATVQSTHPTQTHRQITHLLQHSPKPGSSSSPGGNNSPRPQPQHVLHPQPSPLSTGQSSMQSPNAGSMASIRNNLKSPPAALPRPNSRPNSAISATPSPRPVQMPIGAGGIGTSIAVSNTMRMAPNQMQPNMHTMPMSSSVAPSMAQNKMSLANGMGRMNPGVGNLSNEMTSDMGMNIGGQQIMNPQANFINQPRMPSQGNQMYSMATTANNYGSYNNMPAGQRQMPVNTTGYNDPSMARPPSVSGGIMPQGVPNQNHMSNGMIMGDKSNDNMQMMQQNPMGMMGNMDKSNIPMQPMRVMSHGNMQRHQNPQIQDIGGSMMPQDGSQQQPNIQMSTNIHNINMNQPQATNQDQMVAMSGRAQPGQTATSAPVDPEKRRLIQQQLVLLLHAYKCSKKEQNGDTTNCALPHCRTMKDVLRHMNVCNQGKSCQVAHCASSRQIIAHWRSCNRPECEVCLPLKSVPNNNSGTSNAPMTGPWSTTPSHLNQPTANTPNHVPGPSTGRPFYQDGMMGQNPMSQNTIAMNPQQQNIGGMSNGISINPVPGMAQQPGKTTDSGNFFHPSRVDREWHRDVTEELRNHLVQKLVQAIFPTPQKVSLTDERMRKLVNFARKVECDMYEQANSRSEYYHLLAEKIYKIQKELEEKRASRNRIVDGNQVRMTNPINQVAGMRMPGVQTNPRMAGAQRMRFNAPISNASVMPNRNMEDGMLSNSTGNENNQMGMAADQMMMKFQLASDKIRQNSIDSQISNPPPFNTQPNPMQDSMSNTSMVNDTIGDVFNPAGDVKPNIGQNSIDNMSQGQLVQGDPNNQNNMQMSTTSAQPRLEKLLRETNPSAPSSTAAVTSTGSFYGNQSTQQPRLSFGNSNDQNKGQVASSLQEILQGGSSTTSGSGSNMAGSFVSLPSTNSSTTSNVMTSPPPFVSPQPGTETKPGNMQSGGFPRSASISDSIRTDASVDSGVSVKTENPADKNISFDKGGKPWSPDRKNISVKSEPKTEADEQFPSMSRSDSLTSATTTSHDPFVKQESLNSNETPAAKSKTPQKVFDPLELKVALMPVLEKMYMQEPESAPFRQPVDPQQLHIPDYFDIVKEPMDLSSIRKGLEKGKYKEPWEFIADVWLMFNNAWLYNRRTTRVYKYCTKLKDVFEAEIDPVMQRLGYCCGRKLEFMPMTLCCYGKQLCTIPTGAVYYDYQNRYDYCEKCFNEIPGDAISLADDPSQPTSSITTIPKSQFEKKKNDVLDPEPFEMCNVCGRKMHKICVLHMAPIWPEGFTCNECLSRRGGNRKANRYVSSKLPSNKLSEHIEHRVNDYIKRHDTSGSAGRVHIRVVYSGDKTVEVRPGMKAKFVDTKEMPETFPYRAKAFFAFEEIDGVDVCFFGVHVQEYGSDAPRPNQRRVYLSYLDSVHFFRPRNLRTAVYHEILIGYFDYCKNLGYEFAHIWACPPCEGDDYIFHCHPPEQKIPKPKRLQDWYKKMLDKAIVEQVIIDYKDIFHQAKEDRLQSARELPYFEGDFWPNVLEESIKEIEQEEEDRKQAEANEQAAAEEALLFKFSPLQPDQGSNSGLKNGKQNKKKKANIKKTSQRMTKKKAPQVMNDLSDKLYQIMEKHKEVFFVIRLNTSDAISKSGPTSDPDPTLQCDLMDGRDAFLTMAREKHYEFSSLRRAKWSTMAMLIELHTSGQDKFTYQCNRCRNNVETRYQCTVCHDFDLCISCYNKIGHEHKMDKVGFGIDDGTLRSPGAGSHNSKSSTISVETCLRSLVHACQCRNANCNMPACYTMKKVLQHTKNCKKKSSGTCLICKQLIALCYYHARHCQEAKCPVAFCQNIKLKMKEQERQHRVRQTHLMKRRMMQMKSTPQSGPHTPAAVGNVSANNQSPSVSSQDVNMISPQPQPEGKVASTMMNQNPNPSPLVNQVGPSHMGKPGSVLTPPVQPHQGFGKQPQSSPPVAAVEAALRCKLVADQIAQRDRPGYINQTSSTNVRPITGNRPIVQGPRPVAPNNNQPWPGMRPVQPNMMPPQVPQGNSTGQGPRPKNSEQIMAMLKQNPQLMSKIIQQRRRASQQRQQSPMPNQMQQMTQNPMGAGMQQQTAPGMQTVTMQNNINQPRMNMQPQVSNMQWQQQPQPQHQRIQQHQPSQFQTPAPPYNQAVSQQRVMNMNVRYQQQPPQRMVNQIRHQPMNPVVMRGGMNPQMTNMQQGMQSQLQHHPGMTASTGVPVSHSQQMSVRPTMQQLPPHAMAGRNTPMSQNQGTVPQHMVSNMDQGYNVAGTQQNMMGGGGFSHPVNQATGFNTTGGSFQTNVNVHLNNPNPNQGSLEGYGKIGDK